EKRRTAANLLGAQRHKSWQLRFRLVRSEEDLRRWTADYGSWVGDTLSQVHDYVGLAEMQRFVDPGLMATTDPGAGFSEAHRQLLLELERRREYLRQLIDLLASQS